MSKNLLVSNMFPTDQYPEYGTFVKNFYDGMSERNVTFDKAILIKTSSSKLSKIKSYISFYVKTIFMIKKNNYDLIYIHFTSHSSLPVLLLPKKYKIICNIHGSDINPKGKFKNFFLLISKKIIKKSDLVIVPSNFYKDEVMKMSEISKEKIYTSPSGGINPEIFKKRFNIIYKSNDTITLGFAGRIVKEKGWQTLLEAIMLLKNKKIILKIVGDGKDKQILESTIKKMGLESKVICTGSLPQKQLALFYNEIDFFIFPSENESLGLVGLEAMASGCFLIASDQPGILSYLKDGETGLTFKTGDSTDLMNVIEKAINLNEEERTKIINAGFEESKKYYSQLVIEQLDIKIKELVN